MKESELIRKLNSVGKSIFAQYFSNFADFYSGKISRDECIKTLMLNNVSNENGAAIRCSNAKLIFASKRQNEALVIISKSSRLSCDIVDRANEILKISSR